MLALETSQQASKKGSQGEEGPRESGGQAEESAPHKRPFKASKTPKVLLRKS